MISVLLLTLNSSSDWWCLGEIKQNFIFILFSKLANFIITIKTPKISGRKPDESNFWSRNMVGHFDQRAAGGLTSNRRFVGRPSEVKDLIWNPSALLSTGRTTCAASTGCSGTPPTQNWLYWSAITTSVSIMSKNKTHGFTAPTLCFCFSTKQNTLILVSVTAPVTELNSERCLNSVELEN